MKKYALNKLNSLRTNPDGTILIPGLDTLNEKGTIITGAFNTSNYVAGANAIIDNGTGYLTLSSGADDYSTPTNKIYNSNYGGTNINKWTAKFSAVIPTIDATSFGFSFGTDGSKPAYFRFCTDTAKKGYIEVYLNGVLYATSYGVLPISTGDATNITIRRQVNTFVISWRNVTTGQQLDYTTSANSFYSAGLPPNFGRFTFWGHGGAAVISNFSVANDLRAGAKLAIVIDSEGSSTTHNSAQSFISLLSDKVQESIAPFVGNSNKLEDNNWTEIIATQPENILIYCLSNNVGAGDSTSTVLSKLATVVSTLNAAGYVYGTNLFISNIAPRNDYDVRPYNTALAGVYPNLVDVYTSFKDPVTAYGILAELSQDGIHRIPKGHIQEANIFGNYFKDLGILKYKSYYVPFDSRVYLDRDGDLVLGYNNQYKASHDLEFHDRSKPQIFFRSGTANGTSAGVVNTTVGFITGGEITDTGVKATATTFYGWIYTSGQYYSIYRTGATVGTTYALSTASASHVGYVDFANKSWVIDNPLKYNLASTGGTGLTMRNTYNILPVLTSANGTINNLVSTANAKHGDRSAIINTNTSGTYSWTVLGEVMPNGAIWEYLYSSHNNTWQRINKDPKLNIYTVATLPTVATGAVIGAQAMVTDALSPSYLAVVAAGGNVKVPVVFNGTNWVCH